MMPMDQVNPQNNAWPKNLDTPTARFPDQPLSNQGPSFGMAPLTFPQRQNQATKGPTPASFMKSTPAGKN